MTFFKDLLSSCYKPSFYMDVTEYSFFRVMRYYVSLIILLTVAYLALSGAFSNKIYDSIVQFFHGQVPTIIIEKGQLSTTLEQPYISQVAQFPVVIDTTGAYTDLGPDFPMGILVTKKNFLIKQNYRSKTWYDLSQVDYFLFNQEQLDTWKTPLLWIGLPSYVLFMASNNMTSKLLMVLLICVYGIFLVRNNAIRLRFKQLFAIAIYALTPGLIISFALGLLGLGGPAVFLIDTVVFVLVFTRGVLVNKRAKLL